MTDKDKFGRLIREHLLPMFPGALPSETKPMNSSARAPVQRGSGGTAIRLQLSKTADHAYLITRSQRFSTSERQIMEAFVEASSSVLPHLEEDYGKSLAKKQMDVVVARSVSESVGAPGTRNVLCKVFDTFQQWAQETYEGHRIAVAFGVTESQNGQAGSIKLDGYLKLNLARVLGDGCSTLVTVSSDGFLTGHEYVSQVNAASKTFAPFALIPIAEWATGKRIGVVLNRGGEILVFCDSRMTFARRRGNWVHFCHEPVISQMATNVPRGYARELRLAAYLSALDISFSRVGGAIGLVRKGAEVVGDGLPVQERDRLAGRESDKTKALHSLIGESKYQALGRPLRQEVGGVDGAVVVRHDGRVIAAGAVLAVNISSDEGARKTAAKTLGKYGLGIKISSDGKIEAYTGDPAPEQKPLFEIG